MTVRRTDRVRDQYLSFCVADRWRLRTHRLRSLPAGCHLCVLLLVVPDSGLVCAPVFHVSWHPAGPPQGSFVSGHGFIRAAGFWGCTGQRASSSMPARVHVKCTSQAVIYNLLEASCAGCPTQLVVLAEGMAASHHLKLLLQNALPAALVHLLLVNLESILQAHGNAGA